MKVWRAIISVWWEETFMNKLLHTNFIRMRKSIAFCLSIAFILGWNAVLLFSNYEVMTKYEENIPLDSMLFSFLIIIGVVLSIVISFLIGTDYSDGTIRNKIVIGHKRRNIYMSNFIISALVAVILCLWGKVIVLAIGIPMFGLPEMSLGSLIMLFANSFLLCIAYASIYNMISMLCSNKAHTAAICILSAVILLFLSIYFYSALNQPAMIDQVTSINGEWSTAQVPNPHYLTGIKRDIFQFLQDLLPSGQAAQLANLEVVHPLRLCLYSIIVIAATNFFGLLLFNRKDIK